VEARQFDEKRAEYERRHVRIVGMSPDQPADLKRFRDKYDLHLTFVSDPSHSTLEAYGAWGDRPGRGPGVIRSTVLIAPDGTIERAWYGVKADAHAEEVLAALGA
jgi:thioredoxin-dependent peroxiredoxin